MRPIDPSNPVLAQIRAQAMEWRRRSPAPEPSATEQQQRRPPQGAQDWLSQVARAVAVIPVDDPQRRKRAFRVYVQALLARECRVRRVDDQQFQELVDRVIETMESEPRLRAAMARAGDALLGTTT